MAKFKVKVIGHLCKNNHMAKFGEEVDETQLTSPAYELIDAGFIEPVVEVKSDKKEETEKAIEDIKVEDAKEVKSDKKSK